MKRDAIKRVAFLAKNREGQAARKLVETIDKHKQAEDKCEQIRGYRAEYEAHFDSLSKAGVNSRALSEYRQFLGNLDDAVSQQLSLVNKAAEHVGEHRSEWLHKYHRKSALDQLVELNHREKVKIEDKKQQKELDEVSGRSNRNAG